MDIVVVKCRIHCLSGRETDGGEHFFFCTFKDTRASRWRPAL